jgi:transposase-like protein
LRIEEHYTDLKAFTTDLKEVYTAVTEEAALERLISFKEKWGAQYPAAIKSWEDNWDILSTFYAYLPTIRKIIYTTNILRG